MKRSPLRRASKKRAAQDRRDRATLEAFVLENGFCWICESGDTFWSHIEIHHISGRNHPDRSHRACLFSVCAHCHESVLTNPTDGKTPLERLAFVLSVKKRMDPASYDRELVLRIKGHDVGAVTEEEVLLACNGKDAT